MKAAVADPLRLLVLGTAISPPGTLGGDTRILLELLKRWATRGAVRATVVTSPERRATCLHYGMPDGVEYRLWPDAPGVWSIGAHVRGAVRNARLASALAETLAGRPALLYTASDFLTDVLPAARLRRRVPGLTWVASRYLFVPNPFKGWKHAYDRRLRAPDPMLLLAACYQRLAFSLILGADRFLVTNAVDEAHFTRRGVPASRVLPVYGGVDFRTISATPETAKRYDGCFVGRISPQKGVLDLVEIWARVCARKPTARLALIGSGHAPFERALTRAIGERGIAANVDLLGFLDGEAKHRVYRASRVFLHTSVYDNYGMAACEAMAAGVPAVLFDLPPLRIAYPRGCLRAPRNDHAAFAAAVLRLLDDDSLYDRLSGDAVTWARAQDWDVKADEVLGFMAQAPAAV